MALSQDDRISISKKVVSIPLENAAALDNKAVLEEQKTKAQTRDNANKSLMDDKTVLINGYQLEMGRLDGILRNEVLEQDMIDSAQQKLGNFFAPNNTTVPTPSLPDGVWKNFIPFAGNKAVGKTYGETYGSTPKEGDAIALINAQISTMDAFTAIMRSTGQSCGSSGTCSLPIYTTQVACESATPTPGVWTPGPDIISNDPAVQAASTTLITAVQDWKTFLQGSIAVILTNDTNAGRQAQNNAEIASINGTIAIIDQWLAIQTFDTNHGQTTCVGFNSYNVNLLNQTKYRTDGFTILKNAITARTAHIPTRTGELNTNLGSVTQDLASGNVTGSGLYLERFNIINLRLNIMNGSMRQVEGIKLGQKAMDEAINSNANAASVYDSVMAVSEFRAPATGNKYIHLKSAAAFSNGDSVYIVTDTQAELSATIVNKTGDMVELSIVVPEKYRQNEAARLYKIL